MLTSLKKGMHKNVRREKHKNVRKKKRKNVRREGGGWSKIGEIYLKWINFRIEKISEQRLQWMFAGFSSDMGLSAREPIWKILRYTYLANNPGR